jgi:hypothetical protein
MQASISKQDHFTGGWSSSLSGSPLCSPRGPPLPPSPRPGGLTGNVPKGPIGSKRAPGGTDPL